MANVYSVDLLSGTVPGDGSISEDLPVGFVYVVRDITGFLVPGAGSGASLAIYVDGLVIYRVLAPPLTGRAFQWQGRCVAPGPSVIEANLVSGTAEASVFVSGYQLTLP